MSVIQQETAGPLRAPEKAAVVARTSGRVGVEVAGVLTLLLGAWGAIVPFVGPLFSFSADGSGSWEWTAAHAWLFLLPGAVAIVGGLCMLAGSSGSAGLARFGGFLALVAGAWFVIGPIAWPLLGQGSYFGGSGTLHQFAYWIGYSMGPGVLLAVLGGFVMGRARSEAAAPAVVS